MSRSPFQALGRVIFWRYERGSWQYDILCLLILLFIFLTPRSFFDGRVFEDRARSDELEELIPADNQGASTREPSKKIRRGN